MRTLRQRKLRDVLPSEGRRRSWDGSLSFLWLSLGGTLPGDAPPGPSQSLAVAPGQLQVPLAAQVPGDVSSKPHDDPVGVTLGGLVILLQIVSEMNPLSGPRRRQYCPFYRRNTKGQ